MGSVHCSGFAAAPQQTPLTRNSGLANEGASSNIKSPQFSRPHREAWMLNRLDTFHPEHPAAPSPSFKPAPSTNGTLSLARLNVPHSHGNAANLLKYKKIRDRSNPALFRVLKFLRPPWLAAIPLVEVGLETKAMKPNK